MAAAQRHALPGASAAVVGLVGLALALALGYATSSESCSFARCVRRRGARAASAVQPEAAARAAGGLADAPAAAARELASVVKSIAVPENPLRAKQRPSKDDEREVKGLLGGDEETQET